MRYPTRVNFKTFTLLPGQDCVLHATVLEDLLYDLQPSLGLPRLIIHVVVVGLSSTLK